MDQLIDSGMSGINIIKKQEKPLFYLKTILFGLLLLGLGQSFQKKL